MADKTIFSFQVLQIIVSKVVTERGALASTSEGLHVEKMFWNLVETSKTVAICCCPNLSPRVYNNLSAD